MEKVPGMEQLLIGDPTYMELQQKRAMAKALLESTLGAHQQMPLNQQFRRSPFAVAADFMSAKNAKDQIKSISEQERQLFAKHKEAEAAGTRQLIDEMSQGDSRAAITRALASPYPGVRKLAETMFKSNETNFGKILDNFKGRIDPQSALTSAGGGAHIGGLQLAPPVSPASAVQFPGMPPVLKVPKLDGEAEYKFAPVPQVNIGAGALAVGERKPGWDTLEQQGKYFAQGGKGYEAAQVTQQKLRTTQQVLQTLTENPQMGAGGEALQTARKWAETFGGKPLQLTGTTDQMKMQLQRYVMDELGGLGHQISDADRKFMSEAIGSLDTNPAALRRLLLLGMRTQMRELTRLDTEAKQIADNPSMRAAGIQFPGFTFQTQLPDTTSADELEMIFGNKLPPLRLPKPPGNALIQPPGLPPGVRPVR